MSHDDDEARQLAARARLFAPYEPRQPGQPRRTLLADLILRPAAAGDARAIALLMAERNGIDLAEASQSVSGWFALAQGDHLLLVACQQDSLLGYARVMYVKTPPEPEFHGVPEG